MRNVILVTYDSLRADHCGPWGYDRATTPNLDQLAANGVVFENAIAPASRTNPSMAGVFTGEPLVVRDAVAQPEYARAHLARHGTIAEDLSAAGYATGAFCPNAYASRYYGFDRGFDHFEDFLFDTGLYQRVFNKHLGESRLFTTMRNFRNFVRREEAFKTWDTYIDQIETWVTTQSEPFFLWVFSLDTHFPYLTPREYRQWGSLFDMYYYNWRCNQLIDQLDIELSDRTRQKLIDIYDDAIHFGDVLLAELQDRLAEYDPVFVVHGDHGEAFAERGVYGHFYPSLYEENIHVPLVVSAPQPERIQAPTSLLELPDLIHYLAMTGDFDRRAIGADWAVATDYDGRTHRNLTAIRTQDWKYIRSRTTDGHADELYHLTEDQGEYHDRCGIGDPIEAPLERLVNRRESHEREQLALRAAAAQITAGSRSGDTE